MRYKKGEFHLFSLFSSSKPEALSRFIAMILICIFFTGKHITMALCIAASSGQTMVFAKEPITLTAMEEKAGAEEDFY